ncbi:MAG: hypothetical protein HKN41_01115 [Ilumatobacter sp.]|nr:hypothetical protein [Ilumatobacter sp.]
MPPRRPSMLLPTCLTRAAVLGALAMLTTSCVTGERPTLQALPRVDDEAAAIVLDRLDRARGVDFTATYDIFPTTTGDRIEAVVRQQDGRWRATIGDVDYASDGRESVTCDLETGLCEDFTNDARISDLNVTSRFWADGFATRLAIDAARRVGFSRGHTETIANRSAACADVPLLGGEVVYCALDEGVLARYFGADVSIELTSFTRAVDPQLLSTDADPDV